MLSNSAANFALNVFLGRGGLPDASAEHGALRIRKQPRPEMTRIASGTVIGQRALQGEAARRTAQS